MQYANHEASSHNDRVRERMRLLRETAQVHVDKRCSSAWLREQFIADYPELATKKSAQRVLLGNKWPNLTVTSLPDDIVHYEQPRIPTVRELARLQSFPDWYAFKGVRTSGFKRRRAGVFVPEYTQVANGVPPRMAHAVAARLRQFLLLVNRDSSCQWEIDGGLHERRATGTTRKKLVALNQYFLDRGRVEVGRPAPSRQVG